MVIKWAILAPLIALEFILILIALINCLKAERTNGPKWMWILLILFFNPIGPIAFFIAGRKHS